MTNRILIYLSVVFLAACTATQDPVNRVQTNLVEKSIFQGEWWYTSTSVDVDYDEAFVFNTANAGAPFSGSMSTDYALDYNRGGPSVLGEPAYSFPIARIRWVIDEKYLFAYRSFELTEGGNPDGRDANFRGEPLAVFTIEDHVDVRKDYNSTTGETSNVTVENTSDRKWYSREFMRVDWSQNLLTKFSANDVQSNELFTAFRREPVPFFVQDGSHPELPKAYQPQFVRVKDDPDYARRAEWSDNLADAVHYMSFVTQEVWSPADGCLNTGGICASATATMRNSFLRIPDKHSYAAQAETNAEFDKFGIFRSNQPTYAAGGQDRTVQRKHCASDADCVDGGACDTAARRETECTAAGKAADCRAEENICVGGLTSDLGKTDFLSFYSSRLNFFESSLTDKVCEESWECDGRYTDCANGDDDCQSAQTAICDPAAHRCNVPVSKRKLHPVKYHLSPHFPPYLVRQAFEAVAEWNEVLMRGHRAAKGMLPFDQANTSKGLSTVDLNTNGRVSCQSENPAGFCFCDSPATDQRGTCRRDYEPFESPDKATARGIPNPYDCYVQGPDDKQGPQDYSDYFAEETYGYKFVGDECMLTLAVNSCDVDPGKPCEDLGDLRYNFLTHLQQGGANFGGVAQPLSDPTNGELITVSATIAAESIENVGSLASQFFPVLRGDAPEDSFFAGENVRGYFANAGKVERPVTSVPVTSEGNNIDDSSRPSTTQDADSAKGMAQSSAAALQARIDRAMQRGKKLQGSDGRAAILSDRVLKLKDTPIASQLADAISQELPTGQSNAAANAVSQGVQKPSVVDLDTAQKELDVERQRKAALAARNMDDFNEKLYNSQYFNYYAKKFGGHSTAEASLRMQQAEFKAITLHELGHTLGLRHNFAGSLDRNNYPDGYYKLATKLPLPTFEEYDSPTLKGNGDGNVDGEEAQRFTKDMRDIREQRLQAGSGTVGSASIMDYNGDLSDFSGLGRYDRAAVMYSYFDKVEAYETGDPTASSDVPEGSSPPQSLVGMERPDLHRRELWTYYRGGESCQTNADCPYTAGREGTIYQPLTQRCVPNPRLPASTGRADCSATGACVCSNFYDDFDSYSLGSATSSPEFAPVKYLFCHDNRTSDLSWCTRQDAGESYSEVVEHYRRSFRERYPRTYFRQYSANGPQKGSSYDNVVEAVKIYQHMFFRLSYEGNDYRQSILPLGFSDQLKASAAAFDWLAEIIGAPDVGTYKLDSRDQVYRQVSHTPDDTSGDLSLPVGQGLYLWSEYQTGQNGFFRLQRAGTFLDKILAVQALTKRDWGFQYQVDEFFYVNFYDFFEKEIVDLFAGLISRNPRQYAPRYNADADGSVEYISAFRNFGTRATNQDKTYPAPAIDGADSETLRDFATIQALSEFPVFYDTSFEQRLLVFKLGSGDGYEIPATRRDGTPTCRYGDMGCDQPDYIEYESDRLHTSYRAVTIDPGETNIDDEQQVAFQLLRRLSERQARIRDLSGRTNALSPDESEELPRIQQELQRDESYLEYLIELERQLGISSYFF